MGSIRILEEKDYYVFQQILGSNIDLLDSELYVFEYNGKSRLVVKRGAYADVYKMVSLNEYRVARLICKDSRLDQIDYGEYSLDLRNVPRFINNQTNCIDFIYVVAGTNLVQYSQCNRETGSRVVIEYDGNVRNGIVDINVGGKEPSQVYFQNKVEKENEVQRYVTGGMGFSKVPGKDKFIRIYGMNGNKPVTVPLLSKTYDIAVIEELIRETGFNDTVPSNLLDLLVGDELGLYFELSIVLCNVDKLTSGESKRIKQGSA